MRKVLVVDDEPDILRLNRYILESKDFSVLEAGNGQEAVNLFERNADDLELVVLDLTMPVMDGMDTFEHIKKIKPDIKVLLVTGYDDMWDLDSIIEQENIEILKKPYQIDDFMNIIGKIIN